MDIKYFNYADMKYVATLQNNSPISDGAGGQVDNYINVLTTRMYLEKMRGGQSLATGRITTTKYYTGICRFQQAIILNTDSQFIIRGKTYMIEDYELVDQIPELYIFTLILDQ